MLTPHRHTRDLVMSDFCRIFAEQSALKPKCLMQHTIHTPTPETHTNQFVSTSTQNVLTHMCPLLWANALMNECTAHPDSTWEAKLHAIFAAFDRDLYSCVPLRPTRLWFKSADPEPIELYPYLIDDLADWLEHERPDILPLPGIMYTQAQMMLACSECEGVYLHDLSDDEFADITKDFYENVASTLVHMGVNLGVLPS